MNEAPRKERVVQTRLQLLNSSLKIPPLCRGAVVEISVAFLPQDSLPLWSLAETRN